MRAAATAFVLALVLLPVQLARAANGPTYRDCSFVGGIDPDYVKLAGATADSARNLTVISTQSQVTITASESSDPGDNLGHDTFHVTVSAPGVAAKTISGSGTGHVTLTIPLSGAAVGSAYTVAWSAVFDNGNHSCPGSQDPQNAKPIPFVLNVVSGTQALPPPPSLTGVRQSHRTWREQAAGRHGRKAPVGTAFSYTLSEPATVSFAFSQAVGGRQVKRGSESFQGTSGRNRVAFTGSISGSAFLKPGRYTVVISAVDANGRSAAPQTLRFTIVK